MSVTPDLDAVIDAELARQGNRAAVTIARRDVIVERLRRGAGVGDVARAERLPAEQVIAIGLAAGLNMPRSHATASPPELALIARAAGRDDPTVRRLAKRLQDTVDALTARLDELEASEARRRQAERERAALRSQEAKLRAELEQVRAKLRGAGEPPVKRRRVDPDASAQARQRAVAYYARINQLGGRAAIAAWATANGHRVPDHNLGRIAKHVLDAFEAAHPTTNEGDNQQ